MKARMIVVAVLVAVLVSACNFPFVTESENTLATEIAQTVEAMEAEVKEPTLAAPTSTPAPTATPLPSPTPKPTEEPDPCLLAAFVSETIPDGTEFSPGESFTKTWTFKNAGTCDWNDEYQVIFVKGDQMGGPDEQDIPAETDPGETVKIEMDLTAPSDEGTYQGYWQFETNKGVKFGSNLFWVKIVVE